MLLQAPLVAPLYHLWAQFSNFRRRIHCHRRRNLSHHPALTQIHSLRRCPRQALATKVLHQVVGHLFPYHLLRAQVKAAPQLRAALASLRVSPPVLLRRPAGLILAL